MTNYDTHWGTVHRTIKCRDDWNNIIIYHQDSQRIVKLQKPAMESFKECEDRIAKHLHQSSHHIHITGVGWRSCADQAALYRSDPTRFAPADGSLHPQGLAIDLDMGAPHAEENKRTLLNHGWHFPRADEPWHVSFRISG